MEKIVKTSKGDFKVRELTIDEGLDIKQEGEVKQRTYELVLKCVEPQISLEEFKKLSFKEGIALINAVNEVNGLGDFQNPAKN